MRQADNLNTRWGWFCVAIVTLVLGLSAVSVHTVYAQGVNRDQLERVRTVLRNLGFIETEPYADWSPTVCPSVKGLRTRIANIRPEQLKPGGEFIELYVHIFPPGSEDCIPRFFQQEYDTMSKNTLTRFTLSGGIDAVVQPFSWQRKILPDGRGYPYGYTKGFFACGTVFLDVFGAKAGEPKPGGSQWLESSDTFEAAKKLAEGQVPRTKEWMEKLASALQSAGACKVAAPPTNTPTPTRTATPTQVAATGIFAVGHGCSYNEANISPGQVRCVAASTNAPPGAEIAFKWLLDGAVQPETRNTFTRNDKDLAPGTHTITVIAVDNQSKKESQSSSFQFTKPGAPVAPKPVADFSVNVNCRYDSKSDEVVCNAQAVNAPADANLTFDWIWDGKIQREKGSTLIVAVSTTYTLYTAQVRATDSKSGQTTPLISTQIRAGNPPASPLETLLSPEQWIGVNIALTGTPSPDPPEPIKAAAATAAGAAILGLLLAANNALTSATNAASQVADNIAGWLPTTGTGKPVSVPEGTTAGTHEKPSTLAEESSPTPQPIKPTTLPEAPPAPQAIAEPTTLNEAQPIAKPTTLPEVPPILQPISKPTTLAEQRLPKPIMKPPRDYGSGGPNVWDPTIEKQEQMWAQQGVIWDPTILSWRPPRPGEIPPPHDLPEKPSPYQVQQPRERVPIQCLELYDAYVRAQARALALNAEIPLAAERQQQAQDYLNKQLAKFTLKLGWDVADTVLLADGVARLTVALGEAMSHYLPRALAEALESARALFKRTSARTTQVAGKMSEIGKVAADKGRIAENLRAAARTARNEADEAQRLLAEAEEKLSQSQKAVTGMQEEVASTARKLDDALKEQAELAARKALAEEDLHIYKKWNDAYLQYLGKKPAAGIGSRFYEEQFKLDMLSLDISTTKIDISNLRAIPNPSPAQLSQLAQLEGKLAKLQEEALSLKKMLDDAACAFYGVDDVSKITDEFMERHLQEHLRRTMGDELYQKWKTTPTEKLLGAKDELDAISQKLQGLEEQIDPLRQQLNKTQTVVANLQAKAAAAQREVTQAAGAVPLAASAASKTERQANDAEREEKEAQAQFTNAQAELEAAKQEEDAARRELESLQAQANEHAKRKFAETPEEVAQVLIDARDAVKRAVEELKARQAEYDEAMDDVRWLKPLLDECMQKHS